MTGRIMATTALSQLLLIVTILVNGCGETNLQPRAALSPQPAQSTFHVRAHKPRVRGVAGFPHGGFAAIAIDQRCEAIEGFVKAFHQQFLTGLTLAPIDRQCVLEVQQDEENYRLAFKLSRQQDELDLSLVIKASPGGQSTVAMVKIDGGRPVSWDPGSEPFILHANMSHLVVSIAAWLGSTEP